MADDLHPCSLTRNTVHLCVDMQRLFSAEGPWPTPWMDRVLPVVTELAGRHPDRTVFTRFIPPERATDMPVCGSGITGGGRLQRASMLISRCQSFCRRLQSSVRPQP
jgi:nicotinamidase-related amidase